MAEPDPQSSSIQWAWRRASVHIRGTAAIAMGLVVVPAVLGAIFAPTPHYAVVRGNIISLGISLHDRLASAAVPALLGFGVVFLLALIYALGVAPYEQRNALRGLRTQDVASNAETLARVERERDAALAAQSEVRTAMRIHEGGWENHGRLQAFYIDLTNHSSIALEFRIDTFAVHFAGNTAPDKELGSRLVSLPSGLHTRITSNPFFPWLNVHLLGLSGTVCLTISFGALNAHLPFRMETELQILTRDNVGEIVTYLREVSYESHKVGESNNVNP